MHHINFGSHPVDTDVWMIPEMKAGGSDYYEYFLLYTDDTLVISENGEYVLRGHL